MDTFGVDIYHMSAVPVFVTKWDCPGSLCFFTTCQVRAVRVYVSCLAPPPPPLPPPHPPPPPLLNRKCRMAVFPALNRKCGSVPRRTSAASVGWQCSSPDLSRQLWMAVFPAGPQPRASAGSVPRRTSTARLTRCHQEVCQKICQKEVQKTCRKHVRKHQFQDCSASNP